MHTTHGLQGLNSHFITDDIIASQRPSAALIERHDIIEQCVGANVTDVINLQERYEHPICGDGILEEVAFSYDPESFMQRGINYFNFPIHDMDCPSFALLCNIMHVMHGSLRKKDRKVFVHCHSGYGRTGLVIACYLLWDQRVKSASDAIEYVRRRRPKSIQTTTQIKMVHRFERYLRDLWEVFVLDEREALCQLNVFLESELEERRRLSEESTKDTCTSSKKAKSHSTPASSHTPTSVTTPVSHLMSDFYFPSTLLGPKMSHKFTSSMRRTKSQTDIQDILQDDTLPLASTLNTSATHDDLSHPNVLYHGHQHTSSFTPIAQYSATPSQGEHTPFHLVSEDVSVFRHKVLPCVNLSTLVEKQKRLLSGSEARLLGTLPKVLHIVCNNLQRQFLEHTSEDSSQVEEFVSSLIVAFNLESCTDDVLRKVLFLKRKVNQNHWSVLESCTDAVVLVKVLVDFLDQLQNPVWPKDFFTQIDGGGGASDVHVSTPTKSAPTSSVSSTPLKFQVSPPPQRHSHVSSPSQDAKSLPTPPTPSSSLTILKNLPPARYEILLRIARCLSYLQIDNTKYNCKMFCESLCERLAREDLPRLSALLESASKDASFVRKSHHEVSHENNRRASLQLSRSTSASRRLQQLLETNGSTPQSPTNTASPSSPASTVITASPSTPKSVNSSTPQTPNSQAASPLNNSAANASGARASQD